MMPTIPGVRRLRRPVARQYPREPAAPDPPPRRRVGLLGGSFNPAHGGHRRFSVEALKQLGLDEVWWLVAPQNPLKSKTDTAPLPVRMARARAVAAHPRLRVSDLEARMGTRYTVETLPRLQARFPDIAFVWLMGADNLATLHRWHRWQAIVTTMPIAVFAREPYIYAALMGRAARRFEDARIYADFDRLADATPPAWCFLRLRTHPAASSDIRAAGRWPARRATEEH